MNETDFSRLISTRNLMLAWRRVTTADNVAYKRYFRDIFYAYELAIGQNIRDLHERLKGGSYEAQSPSRLFIPKGSGLNRSITLLHVEDQIVLQAITNILAQHIRPRRRKVERTIVFSNYLQPDPKGIFFLEKWQRCYGTYMDHMEVLYKRGFRWIAYFDLAAFYDTISHELLFKTVYSKSSTTQQIEIICDWFKKWITPRPTWPLHHGIPQGPIASNFLSEIFLLPIDEAMSKLSYVRYVDDIRLFGRTEYEVQSAVLKLEALCRDRGLIPQSKKFVISEMTTLNDALGTMPSIGVRADNEVNEIEISVSSAEKHFRSGLSGRPLRVKDKSRVRFVLFHGPPSKKIKKWVLAILPYHPELIDAIAYYLRQYRRSKHLVDVCIDVIRKSPYPIIKGELLHLLAIWTNKREARRILPIAKELVMDKEAGAAGKWGAMVFLCHAEMKDLGHYSHFVLSQPSLVQSLSISYLPDDTLFSTKALTIFLQRKAVEPGLALSIALLRRMKQASLISAFIQNAPSQVRNIFTELCVPNRMEGRVDPMAELLHKRYGTEIRFAWREFFGAEYGHAIQQLIQAEKLFYMGRSQWLFYQNSFNNCLFLSLQEYLNRMSLAGACKTKQPNGKLISYGNMLLGSHPFPKNHAILAGALEETNRRRNRLEGAHPYDQKTGGRNTPLTKKEQTSLVNLLTDGYKALIVFCKSHGIP